MKAEQNKCVSVATKIAHTDKLKLQKIAESFGLSFYELLQALLCSLLHYFDTDSPISFEHSTLLNTLYNSNFEKADTFSPLSWAAHRQERATSAIVFSDMGKGERKSKRPQALLISQKGERLTESYNFDSMLELFLLSAAPEILTALQTTKERLGEFSLLHTLQHIVLARALQPKDVMQDEIAELFSDIRLETGQQINEEAHYKRKNNKANTPSAYTEIRTRYRADI